MATKLQYEVEVDANKAKQQLEQGLGRVETGGGAGTSRSADRAARSLEKLGKTADTSGAEMQRMVRGFAGMAVGLATSYAANFMPQGKARTGVEATGSALMGAAVGNAIAGPIGAAAGLLAGAAKVLMGANAKQDDAKKDFWSAERDYQRGKEWKNRLEGFTDVGKGATIDDLNGSVKAIADEMEELAKRIASRKKAIVEALEEGRIDDANRMRKFYDEDRSKYDQLETLQKEYSKRIEELENRGEHHAGTSLNDNITTIGGTMTKGGNNYLNYPVPEVAKPNGASGEVDAYTRSEIGRKLWGMVEAAQERARERAKDKEIDDLLDSIEPLDNIDSLLGNIEPLASKQGGYGSSTQMEEMNKHLESIDRHISNMKGGEF